MVERWFVYSGDSGEVAVDYGRPFVGATDFQSEPEALEYAIMCASLHRDQLTKCLAKHRARLRRMSESKEKERAV